MLSKTSLKASNALEDTLAQTTKLNNLTDEQKLDIALAFCSSRMEEWSLYLKRMLEITKIVEAETKE